MLSCCRKGGKAVKRQKKWYDYLWLATILYFSLGFFNIIWAWLGLIFFLTPLILALGGWGKIYCNRYCDRGQFFTLLGGRLGLSRKKPAPKWLRSRPFRYGFLLFFWVMFGQMLYTTYLVFTASAEAGSFVQLFWTFKVPWHWAYPLGVTPWVAQFAYGFYSLMLTSTLIGLIVMALFKPRTWCVFCPMGTMTQLICQARAKLGRKTANAAKEV